MKKALVLSLVAVLCLGFASFAQMGTLTGYWDTKIEVMPTLGITSTIEVTYSVSGWDFTSTTGITDTGWETQVFSVDGSLGAFTVGSVLTFDPSVPEFTSWVVDGGLSIAGVLITGVFTLDDTGTGFVLTVGGSAGSVDVFGTINFGDPDTTDCDFDWTGVSLDVDFTFCCVKVLSTISFTCDGFDELTFTVENIQIPNVPWLTLGATITFTVDSKTLVLTPGVDFGTIGCIDIYFAGIDGGTFPADDALSVGIFSIEGIGIRCETPNGVNFEGVSYWGDGDGKPTWLKDYWEGYRIYTDDDSCCGGNFTFGLAALFDADGLLFDIAEFDANFDITISQLTFGMILEMDLITPSTTWTLHFRVDF